LVELGADVEARDSNRQTALHWAANNGHHDMVKFLVELSADVEARDSNGQTALHLAVSNGHHDIIRFLVELGADVEAKDGNGQAALHWAASNGHYDTIRFLVELGADVEAKDGNGQAALHWAASNEHYDTIRFLVELGADVEARDSNRQTALHWAASNGHHDTVRALVQLGAEVGAGDDDRWTALHWATSSRHETTVRTLIKLGADVNNEADFKADDNKREMPPRIESPTKVLTQEGGVKLRCTPLWLATENDHLEVFQHLVEAGANRNFITLEDHSGWVSAVTFSPDGRLIASGSADSTVGLWTPQRGCRLSLRAILMRSMTLHSHQTVSWSHRPRMIIPLRSGIRQLQQCELGLKAISGGPGYCILTGW